MGKKFDCLKIGLFQRPEMLCKNFHELQVRGINMESKSSKLYCVEISKNGSNFVIFYAVLLPLTFVSNYDSIKLAIVPVLLTTLSKFISKAGNKQQNA